MTGAIHIDRARPGVVLIEIDVPPVNALDPPALRQILTALDDAENDLSVRVVVLAGRNNNFCAGADIRKMCGESDEQRDIATVFPALLAKIEGLRVPVVAAMDGVSAGGGLELALVCDIRIASHDAYFIAAAVNVGLIASIYRLPRLIGIGPAKAMLLTGLKTDAQTALRYGLVTELCCRDKMLPTAMALAGRIATRAPLSVEASKRMIGQAFDLTPEAADAALAAALPALFASDDHAQAIAKFPSREALVFSRR